MAIGLFGFSTLLADAGRDILPIVLVIGFFQIIVLRQPLPDLESLLLGLFLVVLGLTFFIQGLELALFPIGQDMAGALAKKGSLFWLISFAFCLGFGTTVAEPALIAVTGEAGRIAAGAGLVGNSAADISAYARGLRLTVALAVGMALMIGVWRIIAGWPIHYLIIGGYLLVLVLTAFAPLEIVGIAYDSGGVTTSTITVPLVTALGIGLSTSIRGRNPLADGFGLIAFASLTPIIFVLVYGIIV